MNTHRSDSGPSQAGAPIRLALLGGLRLCGAGAEPAQEATARHHVRAVLALAGASVQGIERDALADALWPGSSAEAARNRLYHTVHLARRALSDAAWEDDWIVVRQGRVMLDERVACDVQQLERCVAGQPPQPLGPQQTLALCQADWMPELQVGVLGESVRGRVRAQQLQALQQAVHQVAAQGDSSILRALLQALLRIGPTDEAASRALMQLDLQAGRQHAVLRTFDRVSRALGTQLGLRPGDATCALAAQASQQLQSAPDAAEQRRAPGALVGREALVRDLVGQVTARAGVWNLTGLGGIGKTSVAREVANRAAPLLEEGVVLVSLGDLQAYGGVAAACAHVMSLSPTPGQSEMQLLVHAMRVRKMLLVLDDVDVAEDLLALRDAVAVDQLQARVLLLSRGPIDWSAAQPVAVPALASPGESDAVRDGARTASFALFQMRCPVPGPEQDTPAWQADVVALLRRLEGLPLAIELAAARTASLTPREILAEIERGAMLGDEGPVDLQGRHRSLQASLDWSVGLLSDPARRVYRALSVFPGMFKREAVGALTPAVGVQDSAADASIDELLAAGLVKALDEDIEPQRLRLLHLPRAHARAQAAEKGEWQELQAERLRAVCQVLEDNALAPESPLYAARLQRVMQVEEDAMALLAFAQQHDPERFVRVLVVLFESWVTRSAATLLLCWADAGVRSAHSLDMPHAELVFRIGEFRGRNVRDGIERAAEVLGAMAPLLRDERIRQAAHVCLRARVYSFEALVLLQTGRREQAVRLVKDAMTELRLDAEQAAYWTLYCVLASLHCPPGEVKMDIDVLRRRFAVSPLWLAMMNVSFAGPRNTTALDQRLALADEMLGVATVLHSPLGASAALWARAGFLLDLGDSEGAVQSLKEGLRRGRHRDATRMTRVKLTLGLVAIHWRGGDLGAAEQVLNELEADLLLEPQQADILRLQFLLHRCCVSALRGDQESATRPLHDAPVEVIDSIRDQVLCLWGEAAALVALGEGQERRVCELSNLVRMLGSIADPVDFDPRLHDRHFKSTAPMCPPETAQVDEARLQLRAAIRTFHAQLSATNRATATQLATSVDNTSA